MSRTPAQVVAWAKNQDARNTGGWKGMCLKFSRMAAGAPGGVYDANTAWRRAKYRHTKGTPPRGAIVFWTNSRHGHVAVSAGGGKVYSTDLPTSGRVGLVTIKYVAQRWGRSMHYAGWTEDVNGVHIKGLVKRATPPKPAVTKMKATWYHVDPKKVTSGLNWYSASYKPRGTRKPNFNVEVFGTATHNGHKYAVTKSGNRYRLDYLAKGKK